MLEIDTRDSAWRFNLRRWVAATEAVELESVVRVVGAEWTPAMRALMPQCESPIRGSPIFFPKFGTSENEAKPGSLKISRVFPHSDADPDAPGDEPPLTA